MITAKFQRLHPCMKGQATRRDYWENCSMSGCVLNQWWRSLTENTRSITHSTARVYVSNIISTAMPMSAEFSYASLLLILLLPVNVRYFWLTTYTYIGSQYISVLLRYTLCPICFRLMATSLIFKTPGHRTVFPVVFPRCLTQNLACSRWNFVAIMFTSWDIRNILSTSG